MKTTLMLISALGLLAPVRAPALCPGVSGSASFCLQQATLNGGGQSITSASFRMTASLGQESVIGVSASPGYVLQSGFWSYYGAGLVPVLLTVRKNGVTPAHPDLIWTGNNSPYSIYRLAGATGAAACATVFNNLITTQLPQTYTDAAPPAQPLICYSILATAPGPTPPEGTPFSPNPAGTLDAALPE